VHAEFLLVKYAGKI